MNWRRRKKEDKDSKDRDEWDEWNAWDDYWFEDDFFRDFEEHFRQMRAYMNEMFKKAMRGEVIPPEKGGPIVYGWSMRVGPDGKPQVREFGNVRAFSPFRREGVRPLGEGVREPLTDVLESDDEVTIIAEMPGIDKEDIELEMTDDVLVLTVEKGPRKYYKEMKMPMDVDVNNAIAKYNNGVLEIKLKKKSKKKKGKKIKIL